MKILLRNFINLLSIGVFETEDTVELMSEYKWNKLLHIAKVNNVQDFINIGIAKTEVANPSLIPQNISHAITVEVCRPLETNKANDGYSDFSISRKAKKFSCFYFNHQYEKLVSAEIHNIDTSVESLLLLNKLLGNINSLLNSGLDLRLLADLGTYLRNYGDKIDFVKIDNWIKLLNIKKMASLIGVCLIQIFHFEKEELPFIKYESKKYTRNIASAFEKNLTVQANSAPEINEDNGNSINPISRPNTHPLKYFSYYPLEATSRFISNIIKSLSNIDE